MSFSSCVVGQDTPGKHSQFLGFRIVGDKDKIVIPFESYNNLIVIPVVLNNTLPLKFILDTGVRTAILMDKKISDVLGLSYSRTITLIGASGGEGVAAHVAPNISLNLPGVVGAGQALLVMDKDYLQLGETLGVDVHGIIGYEIFNRFIVEINYIRNIITLYEPRTFRKKRRFRRFNEIPLNVEDTKPYLNTTIIIKNKSIESKLLIDTGASHSLLLHLDSHEEIALPKKTIATNLGRSLGGDIKGHLGRTKEVNFSGYKIHNVITSFPELGSYTDIISITERNGSIGGGIINRFDIIFDYSNQRIFVKRNSDFKRRSNYNMSGIEIKAEGPDYKKLIVTEVLKGSPADLQDIRVGDEIVMANGLSKNNLTLNFLNTLFKSKENRKINMRINRNEEIIKKSFRLKKII